MEYRRAMINKQENHHLEHRRTMIDQQKNTMVNQQKNHHLEYRSTMINQQENHYGQSTREPLWSIYKITTIWSIEE